MQHEGTERSYAMYAKLMKTFDHVAITYFVALAITPMLALAATGAIR
jgi:hypothetical protein